MFTESTDTENMIQPSKQDHLGAYLIDRSPLYFEPLLNYLRHGQIILDSNVNVAGIYLHLYLSCCKESALHLNIIYI